MWQISFLHDIGASVVILGYRSYWVLQCYWAPMLSSRGGSIGRIYKKTDDNQSFEDMDDIEAESEQKREPSC